MKQHRPNIESTTEFTIGCVIMSYRSPKTLLNTLNTYRKQNLLAYFDQVLVLFQEISPEDQKIARDFDLPYIGTGKNVGIYAGVKMLAEQVKTDYILLLENDCILLGNKSDNIKYLDLAVYRLVNNHVDLYRLRHRLEPGENFDTIKKYKKYHLEVNQDYSLYKLLLRLLRPGKYKKLIGTAVYVHENPKGYLYDKYIIRQPEGDFIIDSAVLPWTNQSILCKREWLLETILPYVAKHPSRRRVNGFQDIEKSLNCRWWKENHFKIGVGTGLFSHQRLDR